MNIFLFSFPRPLALAVRKHPEIRESGWGGVGSTGVQMRGVRGCCGCLGLCIEACDIGRGWAEVCVSCHLVCVTSFLCLWDVIVAAVWGGLCGAGVGL